MRWAKPDNLAEGKKGRLFPDASSHSCIIAEGEFNGQSILLFGLENQPMRLVVENIEDLLPLLEHFAKTGKLP